MVVADRIELSLTAYQTVFLPLEDATLLGCTVEVQIDFVFGCGAENRTRILRLMRPGWEPTLPAVLVFDQGVEP